MGKFILISSGLLILASISYEAIEWSNGNIPRTRDIVIAVLFAIVLIIATAVKLASGAKRVRPNITDNAQGRKIVISVAEDESSDRRYLVNSKQLLFPDN